MDKDNNSTKVENVENKAKNNLAFDLDNILLVKTNGHWSEGGLFSCHRPMCPKRVCDLGHEHPHLEHCPTLDQLNKF